MSALVTRDPADPTFPHGTTAGRYRGCDCGPCDLAEYRYGKAKRLRHARGIKHSSRTFLAQADADRLIDSVLHALSTGASRSDLARLGDMALSSLSYVLRTRKVTMLNAARLETIIKKAPTLDALDRGLVPSVELTRRLWMAQAAGWPVSTIAERGGLDYSSLCEVARGEHEFTKAATAQRIMAVLDQIGDRMATPQYGLGQRAITFTKNRARDAGYYPPAAYDDNGALVPEWVGGRPLDAATEAFVFALAAMTELVTNHEATIKGTGRKLTPPGGKQITTIRRVERLLDYMKLRNRDPDCEARRRTLLAALREHDRVGTFPAIALRDLGVPGTRTGLRPPRQTTPATVAAARATTEAAAA